MKIAGHLTKEQKRQLNKMASPKKKRKKKRMPKPKNEEKLSFREWENIMGIHRDIYIRHNGAVRRK